MKKINQYILIMSFYTKLVRENQILKIKSVDYISGLYVFIYNGNGKEDIVFFF